MELNTKKDYEQLLMKILEPVRGMLEQNISMPCAGSSAAWYSDAACGAETFSRPLWGLVPYWRGGGDKDGLAELYRRGIAKGQIRNQRDTGVNAETVISATLKWLLWHTAYLLCRK